MTSVGATTAIDPETDIDPDVGPIGLEIGPSEIGGLETGGTDAGAASIELDDLGGRDAGLSSAMSL